MNTTPKGVVLALYDGCSERASTTPEGTMAQHAHVVDVVDSCSSRTTNTTPKGIRAGVVDAMNRREGSTKKISVGRLSI